MMRSTVALVPRRMQRRRLIAWTCVALGLILVTVCTLSFGDAGIPPADAIAALWGSGDPGTLLIVREWRVPRAVLGAAVGAMLALSGALFQIVTRNPLGSPDVLGFSAGAFTGVLLVMAAGSVSAAALVGSAFAGGMATVVVVLMLAMRRRVVGFALIVTGIGVTAIVGALNTILIMRSDDLLARSAALWATGSLNGVDGAWIAPVLGGLAVGGALTALLAPALAAHELGDERATTLGARPVAVRRAAMTLGVALLAFATAVTGPIAFIALAAPQIARRAWRSGTVPLTASAAVGALLLCTSDLISARLFAPAILPTGLVTLCLGGAYLAWLLSRRERTDG